MRRGLALLGLLNLVLAGCVTGGPAGFPSAPAAKPLLGMPADPDTVVLYVALVERPIGDRYLNQDLWALADEQVVSVERRAVLEENGFRVGQVGGIIPAGLLGLLTSGRSCVNPRCIQLHAGRPTTLALGPTLPLCRFDVRVADRETPVELQQARCALVVTPTPEADGRTRLRFTPQVQHGEALAVPRPVADAAGVYNWELDEQRPTEAYDALGWEVVLGPSEYAIVGASYDRPDTLGHRCFIVKEPPDPAQRLLVIRTGRPPEMPDGNEGAGAPREPPPALQAFYTSGH